MDFRPLILAGVAALAGCATVTRGTTNQIQITSEPSGANVRTSLGYTCVSPCTVTMDRKTEFFVTYTLEGYREVSVPVRTQAAVAGVAGVAGNVLVGGIVGVGVDAVTGAGLEHVPNPVHVVLQRADQRPSAPRR